MKQFYTCWVDGSNGGYGYKHTSFEAAKQEAERLANLPPNDGKLVFVLCCLGFAKVNKVLWENTEADLPF